MHHYNLVTPQCSCMVACLVLVQYAQHQHPREQLADADSMFKSAQGISVHCKQASPAQPTQTQPNDAAAEEGRFFRIFSRRKSAGRSADGEASSTDSATSAAAATAAIALYHGFGANLWSWAKVQQDLADAAGMPVVAHDMPGFGLTERPATQSSYTLQTNGDIGRQLAAEALAGGSESSKGGTSDSPQAARTGACRSSQGFLHPAGSSVGALSASLCVAPAWRHVVCARAHAPTPKMLSAHLQ